MPTAVVIPAYNAADHLPATLRSVWAQTRPPAEVVVVDDGSTDGTARVAADLGARTVIQDNAGPAVARNRGRSELSPDIDYALFLDADDILEPEAIEVLQGHLDAHDEVGLAYCRLSLIDDCGRPKGNRGAWPARHGRGRFARPWVIPDDVAKTPMVSILDFVAIIPSVSMYRLSVLDAIGGWCEKYPGGAADTAVTVEVALQSAVHFVPRDLVRYRSHDGQISANVERVQRRQAELHARLRRRTDPELMEAWQVYDRQLLPQRALLGVRRAIRERRLADALRISAGTARSVTRSYAASLRRRGAPTEPG